MRELIEQVANTLECDQAQQNFLKTFQPSDDLLSSLNSYWMSQLATLSKNTFTERMCLEAPANSFEQWFTRFESNVLPTINRFGLPNEQST